jgi:hypothetical protein
VTIDPESLFRNEIEGMLSTVSWVEKVKNRLGIEGVSQIWGDAPAWYFWISDARGVYHFQLSEASISKDHPKTARGVFTIKCYPYSHRDAFSSFSFQERHLMQSRLFDDTHTPRFEDRERIPDALFNAGVIEYTVGLDDDMRCVTLESLDTLRIGYEKETVQEYELIGKSRHFKKGEIDRFVPGWKLGYCFFDRLLCMLAFYCKAKPMRLRITRSSGFEYVYTGGDTFECIDAPDIPCFSASLFFGPADGHPCSVDFQAHHPAEPDFDPDTAEVLYDQTFHCGHYHPLDTSILNKLPEETHINPLWWSLADAEHKSELASSCGCT